MLIKNESTMIKLNSIPSMYILHVAFGYEKKESSSGNFHNRKVYI